MGTGNPGWFAATELRGFEPLTSAVQAPARLTGSRLPFLGGWSATSATAGAGLKPNACSSALRRQRLERLAGLDENRLVAGRGLKAPHDHIDVEQIELGARRPAAIWTRRCGSCGRGGGRRSLGGRWRLRERRGRDLAANASGPTIKAMGKAPNEANAEISRDGRAQNRRHSAGAVQIGLRALFTGDYIVPPRVALSRNVIPAILLLEIDLLRLQLLLARDAEEFGGEIGAPLSSGANKCDRRSPGLCDNRRALFSTMQSPHTGIPRMGVSSRSPSIKPSDGRVRCRSPREPLP